MERDCCLTFSCIYFSFLEISKNKEDKECKKTMVKKHEIFIFIEFL